LSLIIGFLLIGSCSSRILLSSFPHFFKGPENHFFRLFYTLSVLITGFTWSFFTYSGLFFNPTWEKTLLFVSVAVGAAAGSVISLSPYTSLARLHMTLFLLPIFLKFPYQNTNTRSFSILLIIYYIYLFIQSGRVSKDVKNSLLRLKIISSQNKELQEAKEKALESTKLKNEFLAKISHEVRSPLNGILGMAEVLSLTPLDEEQRKTLQGIQMAGETLLAIVNDVLDFSKIEAGQFQITYAPCDIKQCIFQLVDLKNYHKKNIQLQIHIAPDVPDLILADKKRVSQVLFNLLDNAFKFTPKGSIQVKVSLNKILGSKEAELLFEVHDTGIGIPKEKLKTIFDSFEQVDSSISREYKGTGLGLAISKKLCELMGGKIWAESELHKGSSFYFTIKTKVLKNCTLLENHRKPPFLLSSPETAPAPLHHPKLLLVEDDPLNQDLFKAFCERLNYKVQCVDNGLEAIRLLEKESFDIVFMDIQLPKVSGLETTRLIRHNQWIHKQPKIIALTANAMKGDREACLEAGMDEYMSKPFSLKDLKKIVEHFYPSITPRPHPSPGWRG
ncbi:MAG: response regulator, partial [Bdellovibrio sp.]